MRAAIIQARCGSTRLPQKVLHAMPDGRPILYHVIDAVKRVRGLDAICVATTNLPEDDVIVQHCRRLHVVYSVGHPTDVLDRYRWAAKLLGATVIVRVTSDSPLWLPSNGTRLLEAFSSGEFDYLSNAPDPGTDGWDTEVMSFRTLEQAWNDAADPYDREHVTPYIRTSGKFRVGRLVPARIPNNAKWSVDEPADLERVRSVWLEQHKEAA